MSRNSGMVFVSNSAMFTLLPGEIDSYREEHARSPFFKEAKEWWEVQGTYMLPIVFPEMFRDRCGTNGPIVSGRGIQLPR